MLILAFDTATDVATTALLRNGDVLGERITRAVRLLEDIDALLERAGVEAAELEAITVGTGPGSYTGLRIGLATARALSFSLETPVAGVSTLAALAAGSPGAVPVIDARRHEVFTDEEGKPRCVRPDDVAVVPGTRYVGDGAVRYREILEARGGIVFEDGSAAHVPWARHHAALARDFGEPDRIEPIYLRLPDAERRVAGRSAQAATSVEARR